MSGVQKLFKKITPLFDRVLVERISPQRTTSGGIVLPESISTKSNEGRIVAIGKGKRTMDGKYIPLSVQVGDIVLLNEFGGNDVKLNGKDFVLVREEDILGIVEETDKVVGDAKSVPNVKDLP